MKNQIKIRPRGLTLILSCLFFLSGTIRSRAQAVIVNLSLIEGMDLTPDNIFSYQVQSMASSSTSAEIKGKVHYRNGDVGFTYSFTTTIQPGLNVFNPASVHPTWQFSSMAARELFMEYKTLPQGTYEYCVTVTPKAQGGEAIPGNEGKDCLIRQSQDLFMITLLQPENNAKIQEHYPMLSWIVNYPFASALTYRLRVAEMKNGQNTANAITRNNPVYEERNLVQPSVVYPVYAKELETFQPYAWTVDAYYKGVLLGGAEAWKFTIIEDSLLKDIPQNPPYIDLNLEQGNFVLYAIGELKLKYTEEEVRANKISFSISDENNNPIKFKEKPWEVHKGENRTVLALSEKLDLRHLKSYRLTAVTETGHQFIVSFKYVNPLFLNN
jgi:hypothetical protein